MIDVRELRIGNYVLYKGNIAEITGISLRHINTRMFYKTAVTPTGLENNQLDLEDCVHIPLTKELLWKCGFSGIKNRKTFRLTPKVAYELKYQPRERQDSCFFVIVRDNEEFNHVVPADNDKECCLIPIRSLSHLQNLYFDLSRKELEIKLD